MSDYLVKSLVCDGHLRAYAIDATQTVREAQTRQDTWSASSAALGRSLVGTLLLATASLKGDEKLTVKINGNGPAGGIVVDGNSKGTVKGYIQNPHVHLPLNDKGKIDVKGAVGTEGFFAVTKDYGLKEPFTGQVPLVSGEIAEDFTYYVAKSEQIPSAFGLSVFVNNDNTIGTAGGFMIQVLPNCPSEILDKLEATLKNLTPISTMMQNGLTPEDMLNKLFGVENVEILEKMPVKFECDCSKERFAKALASLPQKDVNEMIAEDHGATAVCHFCGNEYHFDEAELAEIAAQARMK
ncbi:molecular chaperone Hsp33 [Ligilactobacillus sp. WC1T17]|uniref:33 kDa chaperonin n=1 Tax=Ligilactobacillus ruminis TaxID=1623 RepID=A0ABY1ACE0_9LACO|nr:molecular chaperone Hsp33 [Ligilactobacillus ruminis]